MVVYFNKEKGRKKPNFGLFQENFFTIKIYDLFIKRIVLNQDKYIL